MNQEIRQDDLVVVRLNLRSKEDAKIVSLDETVSVKNLDVRLNNGERQAPVFDSVEYARLMAEGAKGHPELIEEALNMVAELNEATADFVHAGGETPAEGLAESIVDWVLRVRPGGHTYTRNAAEDGYVINTGEINIAGPTQVGEERFWRVTAVGTWGN